MDCDFQYLRASEISYICKISEKKTGKNLEFFEKPAFFCKNFIKFHEKCNFALFLVFLRFRDCSHQKERKKCYKTRYYTLKNSTIQPRTKHLKFSKILKFRV